ncbi:CWF19-like protein 1 [Littorina saxatilis]|uniref:CWF19-like protein 1 n=1 Tax=Littorina saxatilis TaxID=31220 RepID=UPI0038B493F8
MADAKAVKVLVSGDVEGNITRLYTRVNKILKTSGQFDLLLCVGDFFGSDDTDWQQYKSGKLKAPVPTLILGPCKPDLSKYFPDSESPELCENITYLGPRGRYTASSGLQITYLSGIEAEGEKGISTFSSQDVADLLLPVVSNSQYKGTDILLTSQWPRGVDKYATEPETDRRTDSPLIAELARVLRPRYHFAGCEKVHYERQPYRNHKTIQETALPVSRFIALANVANKEKRKYMYACNIVPMSKMGWIELIKQPSDATECPYTPTEIKALTKKQDQEESGQQFFYDMSSRGGDQRGRRRQGQHDRGGRGGKMPRKSFEPSGSCWFCLGSPEVEKHLVVSVATEAYMALAKGGLVPDHVLILPIHHHRCTVTSPDDVLQDVDKYKASLKKFFKAQGKSVVFFERNYKTSHLQIQAVPVPQDSIQDIKDTFSQCAEEASFPLDEIPKHSDLKQIVPAGVPYFYAEIPTGERLLHRIQEQFPLQFGREVMAEPQILNMPERVDWKNCKIDKDEESEQAAAFKSSFRDFDFNFQ